MMSIASWMRSVTPQSFDRRAGYIESDCTTIRKNRCFRTSPAAKTAAIISEIYKKLWSRSVRVRSMAMIVLMCMMFTFHRLEEIDISLYISSPSFNVIDIEFFQ